MQPTCAHPDCLTLCNDDDYCSACFAYVCPEHRVRGHHPGHDPRLAHDPAEHWSPLRLTPEESAQYRAELRQRRENPPCPGCTAQGEHTYGLGCKEDCPDCGDDMASGYFDPTARCPRHRP